MEVACPFTAFYRNFATIDNLDCIPIGLCTIHHKALEIEIWESMPSHDIIEILPKNYLSVFVIRLEIAIGNGYDTLI